MVVPLNEFGKSRVQPGQQGGYGGVLGVGRLDVGCEQPNGQGQHGQSSNKDWDSYSEARSTKNGRVRAAGLWHRVAGQD